MSVEGNDRNIWWYGCIFCRTSSELKVARDLEERWLGVTARAATVVKRRTDHGRKRLSTEVLIPGYVFFQTPEDYFIGRPLPDDAWKVLRSAENVWRLSGRDEWFAAWLIGQDGRIGLSQARKVGDRIQILSGPLKDLEGFIIRVDRRNKSGQVEIIVNGRRLKVWLGFELLDEPMPRALSNEP